MRLYPAFLDLRDASVLVVGGGNVALRKTRGLLEAGARVRVVAPRAVPELTELPVEFLDRAFEDHDVTGAALVFACTNQDAVNDRVAAAARLSGVFVNHASRPEAGNVKLGATLTRGPVTVAVNTGQDLPMLSQALRDHLGRTLPDHLPLEDWRARRAQALACPEPERAAALAALRAHIHDTLEVRA